MIGVVALAVQISYLCPTTDDVVSVYCETVHELLRLNDRPVTRIVLTNGTKLYDFNEENVATALDVSREAARDLKAANHTSVDFPPDLEFETPYVALPEADAFAVFRARTEPLDGNLLVTLSAISFSADRREALVYGSFICGGLCGQGI